MLHACMIGTQYARSLVIEELGLVEDDDDEDDGGGGDGGEGGKNASTAVRVHTHTPRLARIVRAEKSERNNRMTDRHQQSRCSCIIAGEKQTSERRTSSPLLGIFSLSRARALARSSSLSLCVLLLSLQRPPPHGSD